MDRRIIWIVLDSVGMGEAPDADKFGDVGADTFSHTYESNGGLNIPNLISLGIGNIDGISSVPKESNPIGAYGKLKEMSMGKDTTIGHWEMAGIYSKNPFPVYPDGFPDYIIEEFIKKTGVPGVLCNKPASGTEIINRLGDEHIKTGKPIVYTSGDSVFQIAAHNDVIPLEELYRMCRIAREILIGENGVARVIARPFAGSSGQYVRTPDRRDFSLKPSTENVLSVAKSHGLDVIAVGKIEDIFAGVGITEAVHTKDNRDGIDKTLEYIQKENNGIIFTNLVEFDSAWGHRRDYVSYGRGLEEFDAGLSEIMKCMKEKDVLIITADHGCDPTFKGTDHTREYVPVLVYGKSVKKGVNLHTRETFGDIAATISDILSIPKVGVGKSFFDDIM